MIPKRQTSTQSIESYNSTRSQIATCKTLLVLIPLLGLNQLLPFSFEANVKKDHLDWTEIAAIVVSFLRALQSGIK